MRRCSYGQSALALLIEKCDEFQSFKENFHDGCRTIKFIRRCILAALSAYLVSGESRALRAKNTSTREPLEEWFRSMRSSHGGMVWGRCCPLSQPSQLFAGLHSKLRSKASDKRRCQGAPSRVMSGMIVSKRHSNGAWCCGGLAPGARRCIQRYDFSNAGANAFAVSEANKNVPKFVLHIALLYTTYWSFSAVFHKFCMYPTFIEIWSLAFLGPCEIDQIFKLARDVHGQKAPPLKLSHRLPTSHDKSIYIYICIDVAWQDTWKQQVWEGFPEMPKFHSVSGY